MGSSMAVSSHARGPAVEGAAPLLPSDASEAPREDDAAAAARFPSPPHEFSVRPPTAELTPPSGSGDEGATPGRPESPRGSYRGSEPPHGEGESFLLFDDSAEDNGGNSSGAATAGHGSTEYRSVGVQVDPVMLGGSESSTVVRRHSWPL